MRAVLAVVLLCISLSAARAGYDEGIAAYERGDYATALGEFLPMAQAGDALAQSYVGVIYHYGLGIEADLAKAIDWYARAADNGDATAQRILGDLHIEGVAGPPDYAAAAQWYEAAAKGGDTEAQRKLGELYLKGRGVPRNPTIAAQWLNSAKELSDPEARRKIREAQVKRPTSRRKKHRRTRTASLRMPSSCISGMPDAPYHVDVKVEFPESNIDHSRSIEELGRIAGFGHNVRALGLMKPDLRLETRPKAQGMPMGDKFCFWITGFEIALRYRRVDIYVAKEYRSGSCPYRAILEHEKRHVRISRRNLKQFAARIREALNSSHIPTAQTPIIVESSAAAKRDVQEISKELLEPVYKSMIRSLIRAQKMLDSPQSYARVQRRCSDW